MRKIGIILFSNIKYSPYADFYIDIINKTPETECDIIYFDRNSELCELVDEHHIPIKWVGNKDSRLFGKISSFLSFIMQTKRVLKKKQYDMLILLTTIPAVLLYPYLNWHYRRKYIFDIRDYTYENVGVFYWIEKKIIESALCTIISSPGFQNFLPNSKYLICHNISEKISKSKGAQYSFKRASGCIVISYIGTIAYVEQCKRMCDLVLNDERFEFLLYGNEIHVGKVADYVSKLNCPRIKMMGSFNPSDKERIYGASDLVFNCYGNDNMVVKYALSNKLYEGAYYRKPLLVSPITSMKDVSGIYAFGLDLFKIVSLDELYEWYVNLDADSYNLYAGELIKKSLAENEKTRSIIQNELCDSR